MTDRTFAAEARAALEGPRDFVGPTMDTTYTMREVIEALTPIVAAREAGFRAEVERWKEEATNAYHNGHFHGCEGDWDPPTSRRPTPTAEPPADPKPEAEEAGTVVFKSPPGACNEVVIGSIRCNKPAGHEDDHACFLEAAHYAMMYADPTTTNPRGE